MLAKDDVQGTNMNPLSSHRCRSLFLAVGLALASFVSIGSVQAVGFNYSCTVGSSIIFPGDHSFSFSPATSNFQVTSGTASGLLGEMTGAFTIGTITTTIIPGIGMMQTASVSGSGTFVIHDGAFTLSAVLTWVDIAQLGSGVVINTTGTVSLTGITYGGSNPDLLALATAGNGANVLSFQFAPTVSLEELRNGPGAHKTSFSGSVTTVPDRGSTLMLLGLAVAGVAAIRPRLSLPKG
jgi:hypothetical protein